MKKLKNILIIVTIIVVASCSKKDDAPVTTGYPEQNPLTGFLVASGYNQTTRNSINNTNIYEIGFSFIPLVKGKINAIKIKIPNIKSGLRVSIWDKTANSLIRAESVDIGSSDTEITKTISPLELLKDNEYFISFNTNNYYLRQKTDLTDASYPIIIGDIKITSCAVINGTAQVLPTTVSTANYAGDCSFNFQRTE